MPLAKIKKAGEMGEGDLPKIKLIKNEGGEWRCMAPRLDLFALLGDNEDLVHHCLSFLVHDDLPTLVATGCTSKTLKDVTKPLIVEAKQALRTAWEERFGRLQRAPSVATITSSRIADEASADPRTLLWAGGVPVAVELLQRFSVTTLCAHNAAAILFNLSRLPAFASELVAAGSVHKLVEMLLLYKSRSREPACGRAAKFACMTLSNCLATGSGRASAVAVVSALHEAGAAERLVELLRFWSVPAADESEPETLATLKGIHPIASLMWGIAYRSEQGSAGLGAAGCVTLALDLLRSNDADLRFEAAGLLANLVREDSNRQMVRDYPAAFPLLHSLARSDDACPSPGLIEHYGKDDERTVMCLVQLALDHLLSDEEGSSCEEEGSGEEESVGEDAGDLDASTLGAPGSDGGPSAGSTGLTPELARLSVVKSGQMWQAYVSPPRPKMA